MVLDLMRGGDLRMHMKDKVWREAEAQFVFAEVASALHYIHGHNIIHRDIKPENILFDEQGHAHLSDFNIAIKVVDGKPIKSFAGTEPYIAPEILNNQNYTYAVDWWSLGVMLYEVLYGERPFRTKIRKELIKRCKYKFPPVSSNYTEYSKSLISSLLTSDQRRRLGAHENYSAFCNHPFFHGINWKDVEMKKCIPMFVPPHFVVFSDDEKTDDLQQYIAKKSKKTLFNSSTTQTIAAFTVT